MSTRKPETFGVYELLENLHVGKHSLVYRARKPSTDETVILKVLNSEYPTALQLARFQHEFSVMQTLDSPHIPTALDWVAEQNRVGIVLDDIGATGSLEQTPHVRGGLGASLHIAVQVAEALLVLNKTGVIHKDLKPHNIIQNPKTGLVQLIDYGLATSLASEAHSLTGQEDLEGTLPYLAPEQTGRMNSTVDYRTDFYALGIVLYELLTGERPFHADDAIGWVHCHVAKSPPSWCKTHPEIPAILEAIVMKLLSKKKEDRYQSAAVLVRDLHDCHQQWQATGGIEPFVLAQHDISSHFQISQQLYGRETELNTLLGAFDRVTEGQTGELILVAGYSGIGKSALVHEVQRPLVATHGFFIEGKFDQYKSNIPFYAMAQALGQLLQQLLKQPKEALNTWKQAILDALDGQGKVIADIVPELTLVIGEQPAVEGLGGMERLNRLNFLLERFVSVFTTPAHPLVLFLDDLQWLDSASLGFLQNIMQREDSRHLLLIGAYRDNEVDGAHPLIKAVEDLGKANVIVHTLTLPPLAIDAVAHLVADTLRTGRQQVEDLTTLLHKKTGGNPFFLTQFLKTLHQEGLIRFDHDASGWCWTLDQMHSRGFTDNVVDLMLAKLRDLPEATQTLLGLAACVGNQFDLAMLAVIAKHTPTAVARGLWPAMELEILLGDGDQLKLIKNMPTKTAEKDVGDVVADVHLRFLHDRVQQAAYQLITEDKRATVHLEIGRLLLAYYSKEQQQAHCFDLADQLNKGRKLIDNDTEGLSLVRLNLRCGQQALAAAAYSSAVEYLQLACELLSPTGWETQADLTFTTHLELARALYLSSAHEQAETTFQLLLAHTTTPAKHLEVCLSQMNHYNLWGKYERAVETGIYTLKLQGIALPDNENAMQVLLREELQGVADYCVHRDENQMTQTPRMTSPEADLLMKVLDELSYPTYLLGQSTQFAWLSVKMTNLSLTFGHHPSSGAAYALYGFVLCTLGQYDQAATFGRLGTSIAKQYGLAASQAKALFINCAFVEWQAQPLCDVIQTAEEGYDLGLRSGQLVDAGYCALYASNYFLEYSLDKAYQHATTYTPTFKRLFPQTLNLYYISNLWFIANMTDVSLSTFGVSFDKEAFITRHHNVPTTIGRFFGLHIIETYLRRQHLDFEQLMSAIKQIEIGQNGQYHVPRAYLFASLQLLAPYQQISTQQQQAHLEIVNQYQAYMKDYATRCEANALHKYLLVEAEKQRVLDGETGETIHLYLQSIQSAHEHGFLLDEAIGTELLGEYYLGKGLEKEAYLYLTEARYLYERWGGKAKVRQLEDTYPQLAMRHEQGRLASQAEASVSLAGSSVSETVAVTMLDTDSVIKASQALASEINLEALLTTMMDLLLENAGAEQASLLLEKSEAWTLEAVRTVDDRPLRLESPTLLADIPDDLLPKSILHYVIRTQETVVLEQADRTGLFSDDPHIQVTHCPSVLSIPILRHGQLRGVMTLQHFHTEGAFTHERVQVLQTLAAQLAISLDHAQLYESLQISEQKFRRLAESNVLGVLFATTAGQLYDANEAFLVMLGYTRADLPLDWRALTPPEGAARDDIALREFAETGTIDAFEKVFLHRNGYHVPILIGGASIHERHDALVCFVLDLTEAKAAEAEIRQLNDTLEHRVEARTKELHQAQRQLLTQARAAGMAEVATGILHNVGNTLNSLLLSVSLVAERLGELEVESLQELAQLCSDPSQELGALLAPHPTGQHVGAFLQELSQHFQTNQDGLTTEMQQLRSHLDHVTQLITSQKQHTKNILMIEPLNLRDLIEEAATMSLMELPHLTLTVDVGEIDLHIETDRHQVLQILTNVLVNARQALEASEQSAPAIMITLAQPELSRVQIRFTDNGLGIVAEHLTQIFEQGFTTKPEGTGYGLHSAANVAQLLGGTLTATSAGLDQGASFILDLPLVCRTMPEEAEPQLEEAQAS